jgi:hypothetical protein
MTIGSGVTSIGYDSLYPFYGIENVYLYPNPDNLDWNNYEDDLQNSNVKIYVDSNYLDRYKEKFSRLSEKFYAIS